MPAGNVAGNMDQRSARVGKIMNDDFAVFAEHGGDTVGDLFEVVEGLHGRIHGYSGGGRL